MKKQVLALVSVGTLLCSALAAPKMNNRVNASADLSVANSISQIGEINAFDDIVFLDDGVELTSNSTEYADRTGLGLSINAITNSYLDSIEIKDGSPIFDETFRLEKLSQASYGAVNTTETYSYATTNMQYMANNCSSSYGYSSSVTGGVELFSGEANYAYSAVNDLLYGQYTSQYYYRLCTEYANYTYSLPNYSSNLSAYKENLHNNYKQAIISLIENPTEANRDDFFETYGTHLIAKGVYGGRLNAYYAVVSNYIDVTEKYKNNISAGLKAGFEDEISGDADFSFSLRNIVGDSAGSYQERFFVTTRGGSAFSGTSFNSLSSTYASWCNSIENRPSLIATSSDGLIPLWNLLPPEYDNETNRNKVRELYLDYAETKEIDYSKYNKAVLQNPNINQILIRSAEVTINDLGAFNNHADTVVFNNISKYGITVLQANGYTTANITLTLTMKEYNMGYQHILLYNGTSSNATLWAEKKLELGGTATQKNYITQSYDFQIPLSAFNVANPLIVVRYSASGAGPDQWLNKDLKVKITFS